MDIQLQELIDKIKREGIESAQSDAQKLKADAEAEAKRIVENAKKEAANLVAQGKADAERSEKAGIAAVQQASRNLVLAFKDEIQGLLDKLVSASVSEAFALDTIKGILPELLRSWASKNTDSLTVLLSEGNLKKLDDAFKGSLASTLKGGVSFKPAKGIDAGFHIAEKDGSAFYDFSAEAVASLLSAYLNPRLAETLKAAAKGL
jgi:V/A-type H+-transporting ATPase subunit E